MTGTLPTYLSVILSSGCTLSLTSSNVSMKPSSRRISAIARLVREAGTMTSVWRARVPLRMRVSMSAIGSDMLFGLPARLGHAWQLAHQRALAEADAAQAEATHVAARAAAHEASV